MFEGGGIITFHTPALPVWKFLFPGYDPEVYPNRP